ncbi:MAG: SDR family oxidoreductase [Flavobacteriales bacterium]|nr:SDR family oxidoreductase [Flavobacteriales bacterium]
MDFVITGAGSGMGKATAIVLSKIAEARLFLVARNRKNLEQTKAECTNSDRHLVFDMDVRNAGEWKTHLNSILNPNICGLFANAGVGGGNAYGKDDRWDDIISTNLTGTYVSIFECLPYLQQSNVEWRNIIITSSCLARFGVPGYTAYCTAKTGLLGLTKSLALSLADDRILVNALCPGWVETEMAVAGIQRLADLNGNSYDVEFKTQMDLVPLKKISQPEEIARWVEFLFTGKQNSMTGQAIDVNNGSYMI